MHRIHTEKKGIRVLGIAESFRKSGSKSTLAGIVMRRDLIIDGIVFGAATLRGDDSTDSVISMYNVLSRTDINCIILDGLIISMYNIVDGEKIQNSTLIPVIAITFEDSNGIAATLKQNFPQNWESKLAQYSRLGIREPVKLKTGKILFTSYWGLTRRNVTSILNSFTLQGAIPEPIRVAKLAARAAQQRLRWFGQAGREPSEKNEPK